MRKSIIVILLFMLFTSVKSAGAATSLNPDRYHFLGGWGSVAYSGLLQKSYATPAGGVQPAIGLGYRFYYNGFTLTTGVEAQYNYMTNKVGRSNLTLRMMDTEGDGFTMHAIIDNTRDYMQTMNLCVPLAVGFEQKYFYMQVGAKFALNLYGSASTKSLASTKAEYERFIGLFEDMPNHQLRNGQELTSNKYDMTLNPSLLFSGEIGLRMDQITLNPNVYVPQRNCRVYLGLFAEYGILNVHKEVSYGEALTYQETTEGIQFFVIPAMLNDNLRSVRVNPLTVGVRFSVFFKLPDPKTCVICDEISHKQHTQHYNASGRVKW